MNGRDPVEPAALLDATRTVSMVLTAVEELADVLSASRVDGIAVYPFACNIAFSMLAQYAKLKIDDVECYFSSMEYEAKNISHAKAGEVSHVEPMVS